MHSYVRPYIMYVRVTIEIRLRFDLEVFIQLNYIGITTVYIWLNWSCSIKTIAIEK